MLGRTNENIRREETKTAKMKRGIKIIVRR